MKRPVAEQLGSASVQVASNAHPDTQVAIDEILDELDAANAALTLIFYGACHDDQVIAHTLEPVTGARGVAGTTAGEINSAGFAANTMTGISFHGSGVRASVELLPQLKELSLIPVVHLPGKLCRGIGRKKSELHPKRHLWLFLFNGQSGKEDLLTPFFMNAAPRVNLVGATLADDGNIAGARLVHDGRVYRDAAVTILLEYDGPFEAFHNTHVAMTPRRLEVTRVRRDGRHIVQLDGKSALEAYAEALGLAPEEVTSSVLATHPLGYRFRGQPFPISIGQLSPDGSLRVANTVQAGQILHILDAQDLVASSHRCIEGVVERVSAASTPTPSLDALLIVNCRFRHIEASSTGHVDALATALCQGPVCGLNSNGEQFATMHLNHSMAGVAFGSAR
ncbi:FIST signal transduction protein [Bradymonas sediminis]|uniref:Uncharacterized protein n=1 Tax=Bradymonas sediminis TaxID=1548548 RepID=A0A2Z4FNA9_9DELT|nr:FIST N-terminal domain-containing protein [Bradymonas sediminis]AWV90501.1 hypothetical protein DN745_14670 [Bradymonas sediminis]TDP72106.1 hypothetical protein DFR33_10786 [Bradymonas sediminis]